MLCLNICFPSHQPYPSDSLSILVEDLNELSKGCKIWIRITLLIAFGAFQLLFWKMLLYIYIYIYIYIYLSWTHLYLLGYLFSQRICKNQMPPQYVQKSLLSKLQLHLHYIYKLHIVFGLNLKTVWNISESPHIWFACCNAHKRAEALLLLFSSITKGSHITNNPKNLVFIIAFLGTLSLGAHSMCNYSIVLVRS